MGCDATSARWNDADTGQPDEMAEIGVARHERQVMVEARLGDESVRQAGATAARQQPRSQQAGPVPVTLGDLEHWKLQEQVLHRHRDFWIAQQLGQHHRGEGGLCVLEGNRDRFDVGTRSTGQVGDE
jgi:hypothetical protein